MVMFELIYHNIVSKGKLLKEDWKPGSRLHRHHIVPKHHGGSDDEDNFTYLTVREHIICHYLLWKMYKKENDLRSMKLLGAKLTTKQRKLVGVWCRDNKIGFHKADKKERAEWSRRGLLSQRKQYEEDGTKNYYYWSCTPEGRKELARLGGLTRSSEAFNYWASPEGRSERGRLGGQALKGRKVMTNPLTQTWHRVKPEEIDDKLKLGWTFGKPVKTSS